MTSVVTHPAVLCVHCGSVEQLEKPTQLLHYFSATCFQLARCPRCNCPVDPFIESEPLFAWLAVILHNPSAIVHTCVDAHLPVHWRCPFPERPSVAPEDAARTQRRNGWRLFVWLMLCRVLCDAILLCRYDVLLGQVSQLLWQSSCADWSSCWSDLTHTWSLEHPSGLWSWQERADYVRSPANDASVAAAQRPFGASWDDVRLLLGNTGCALVGRAVAIVLCCVLAGVRPWMRRVPMPCVLDALEVGAVGHGLVTAVQLVWGFHAIPITISLLFLTSQGVLGLMCVVGVSQNRAFLAAAVSMTVGWSATIHMWNLLH